MFIQTQEGKDLLEQINSVVAKNEKTRKETLDSNYFDEIKETSVDEKSLKEIKESQQRKPLIRK